MYRSKIFRVSTLALAATALAPATAAFAQATETETETGDFCTDYTGRWEAMQRLNDRLATRYEAASTATPKGQGQSKAPGQAKKAGGSGSRKADAILSLQNRLADRSTKLAERLSSECGTTLTPLTKLAPKTPATSATTTPSIQR